MPLTRTVRDSGSEIVIEPDQANGLAAVSSAQCQHVRSVAVTRITAAMGNVGPIILAEIRETLAILLDVSRPGAQL